MDIVYDGINEVGLKYIIDCKNESKITMNYRKIFNQLCKNGSLDVAKLFYANHHVAITDKLLMQICKLDKIDVLKWLIEKNKKLKIDKGFIISCYDDGCIDIHYKNDIGLKLCHDNVKTWLHEKR